MKYPCVWLVSLFFWGLFTGCAGTQKLDTTRLGKGFAHRLDSLPAFKNSFSGWLVMDAQTGQVIFEDNSNSYFTPASNTKIVTMATSLAYLPDTLPALEYFSVNDSLYFRGVGDPTFLHPDFAAWSGAFDFLAGRHGKLVYVEPAHPPLKYGLGWAWDDFAEDYQPERHVFPIFGNCIAAGMDEGGEVRVFPDNVPVIGQHYPFLKLPEFSSVNKFAMKPGEFYKIPLNSSEIGSFLTDTLHLKRIDQRMPSEGWPQWQLLRSCPRDTVVRKRMIDSDNFLAEQLLLMANYQKFGHWSVDSLIGLAKKEVLPEYSRAPRWVDGSGLSRYNLITPMHLGLLLKKMYDQYSFPYLISFFPAGGANGTLQNWYKGPDGQPFVFAKTGSMSGVYCLSGYVRAKSGKVFIISVMNNNFVGPNATWKRNIQTLLEYLYATG